MPNSETLKISRQDLYELVWSKPIVELAKDLGLSDVGLAKHCRKLGVPTPGGGYWARVAAGQTPRQTPLKKPADDAKVQATAYFDPPRHQPMESRTATEGSPEYKALLDRIIELELPATVDLLSASPVVKRTAVALKRRWRREIKWIRGERTGVIIQIDVSDLIADRALRFCEILLAGARELGWSFAPPPKPDQPSPRRYGYVAEPTPEPSYGVLTVEGERMSIRMDERMRQVENALSEEDKKRKQRGEYVSTPRWNLVPSGDLRFHASAAGERYGVLTWKDRAKERLEDQVKAILARLLEKAASIKALRERQRLEELERRRLEEMRWRQRERREANAALIHELEAQAGAWFRARMLRSYLRALRKTAAGKKLEALRQGMSVDFIEWAQHYVDQLDPLSAEPHDLDLKEDRSSYYGSDDDKVMKAIARALGRHWQDAWKIGEVAASHSVKSAQSEDGDGELDADELPAPLDEDNLEVDD